MARERLEGDFAPARFRPNLLVGTDDAEAGFVEDDWIGHVLAIGEAVRALVVGPCIRCVMTTHAQDGLPKQRRILRAAVQHHRGNVGIYAVVRAPGRVRTGDEVVSLGPEQEPVR
jgi:hypothetical protein